MALANVWKTFLKTLSRKFSFSHLEKLSHSIVVEQKLLSIRLVATVVDVLIEVPLQTEESFSDHAGIIGVELDTFN